MNTPYRLLFIAGVPATGKSTYGQWLEDTHGFIHLDVEISQDSLVKNELQKLVWADPKALVAYLRGLKSPVILDQGFTPSDSSIAHLAALKGEGVECWWFHSERAAAKKAFEARNELLGDDKIDIVAFENQMNLIEKYWSSLKALFEPNILETLRKDLSRMDHQDIFNIMFAGHRS